MEALGVGVTSISKALGGLDDSKIENLKGLRDSLRGMDKVVLNFGVTAPTTPQLQGMSNAEAGQTINNAIMQPQVSQVNNVVKQSYRATGAKAVHNYIHNNTLS